jgi:putative DNA primase/helicase
MFDINGHSPKSPRSIPKPEAAEMKRSAAASQEKNQKNTQIERTVIADRLKSLYSPIFLNNQFYLYRDETGAYSVTDSAEIDAIIECLVDSPADNSQALTNAVRHELKRRCYQKEILFNPQSFLINFSNQVYDLQSQTWLPHDREYLFDYTMQCDPSRTSKKDFADSHVRKFLCQICEGDQMKLKLLQEHCGILLTGLPCKGAFFWIGVHDSGKSTLANLLRHTIGASLTSAVPFEQFDSQFGTSALCNSRINIAGELNRKSTEEQWYFFKQVTGGDTVSVEAKYCAAVHTVITSKLLFLGNFMPHIPNDEALYDRINMLEFTYSVPREKRDPELLQRLISEKDIFARWALRGAERYLKNHYLLTSYSVSRDIHMIGNPIAHFLNQFLEKASAEEYIEKTKLYETFRCKCPPQLIENTPSKQSFYKELRTFFPDSVERRITINGKKEYVIYGICYKN